MRHRTLIYALALNGALGLASAGGAEKSESENARLPPGAKVPVHASVDLLQVSQIQDHDEKFDIEFYLYLSWSDPRLAFDAKKEGRQKKVVPIDEIWSPEPDLLDELDETIHGGREAHVNADGTVFYHQYYRATISTNFDLHEFPLDGHALEVKIESPSFDSDELVYVAGEIKHSGERRPVPNGWNLLGTKAEVRTKTYPVINESYSQFAFKVDVQRDPHFYFWAIVLPLLPIVVTSWCVFWMAFDEFGAQAGVGITAMLTIVAYKITIDSNLPPLGYMTRMDFFLLVCQIFVFGSFLLAVAIHVCRRLGTPEMTAFADRLTDGCRWISPLLMAVTCVLLTVLHPAVFSLVFVVAFCLAFLLCRPTVGRLRRLVRAIFFPEHLVSNDVSTAHVETGRVEVGPNLAETEETNRRTAG